jgi:hypothetical protein
VDAVNITETLAVHLKDLDQGATAYTQAATDALRAARARYRAGASLRLDGPGIEALRALLSIYEQCLTLLTEARVSEAMRRTAEEVRRLLKAGAVEETL